MAKRTRGRRPDAGPPSRGRIGRASGTGGGRLRWIAAAAALAVAIPALTGEFVWDDRWTIAQSPVLSQPHLLGRILTEGHGWGTFVSPEEGTGYYRPLPGLIHGIMLILFGSNPLPFRLLNAALHAGAALLLGGLLARRSPRAAWGAILFAVHPALADAFGWCSAAPDLMATLLLLASATLATASGKTNARLPLAAGCWLLALLSKESALAGIAWFPVVAALDRGGRIPRPSRRAILWFAGAAAIAVALRARAVGFEGWTPERPPGVTASGIDLVGRLAALNLLRLFLPIRLTLEPPVWAIAGPAGIATVAGLLAGIGGAAIAAVLLFRRGSAGWGLDPIRALAAGYLLLMAGMTPVLQIVPTSDLYGGRFLVLPIAGLAAGIGWAIGSRALPPPRAVVVVLSLLCTGLGIRSAARAAEWRSDASLFSREFARQPDSIRARLNWAGHLFGEGRLPEARAVVEGTEQRLPHHPRVRYQRALLLLNEGRASESEAIFRELLRDWKRTPTLLANLANAQMRQGRLEEGLATLDEAERGMTPTAGMRNNRGIALKLLGRRAEARRQFEAAIAQDPSYRPARVNLIDLLLADRLDPEAGRRAAGDFLARFPSAPETPRIRALVDSLGTPPIR